MHKKSMLKAVVVIIVALVFVLPGSAVFTNIEETMNKNVSSSDVDNSLQTLDDVAIGNTESVDWWPMYRHDLNHTGYSTSSAPDTNDLIWSFDTAGWIECSSPAVVDGKVYIGSYDDNVYCLNASDGSLIWKYDTGGWVTSSPTVADGNVYIGCMKVYGAPFENKMFCMDASDGSLIWSYPIGEWIYMASPAVADGKVFIGCADWYNPSDNKMFCLDASDGSLIWKYNTSGAILSCPAVVDGKIYFGCNDKNVYCLNAQDGSLIWKYTARWDVYGSCTVVKGKVFFGSVDHNVYCLDESDGSLIWTYSAGGGVVSSPAVADGKVYIGSTDHVFYCLDALDGLEVWKYTTGDYIAYSSAAVADGKVYFGSDDRKVYCLNAQNGSLIWKYRTYDMVRSSPAVADGKVYIGSNDGKIYCFGPQPPNYPPYEPSNPDPANGSTGVDVDADLSWTGGDPNPGDTVTYDIYFGTVSPPPQVWSQSGIIYDPGTMKYNTRYYWKIVAWDNHRLSNESLIWSFTTMPDTTPPEITDVRASPDVQFSGGYINITAMVTDNVEVDAVYLHILCPDSSIENFSITENKTGDTYYCNKTYDQVGVHTFHIWANDINGNTGISADYTFEIKEDTTPPVTTCDLDGIMGGGVYITDVTVTLTATDDISGVAGTFYRLNDGKWQNYTIPFVVSEDGVHTVSFYSVDNAGNTEKPKTEIFTIQHPCPIEIEISGGVGVNAVITNTGEDDIIDLEWSITITGGLLGLIDKEVNGTIPILVVGAEETVKSGLFLGIGSISITVIAGCAEENVAGKQIIIFTKVG